VFHHEEKTILLVEDEALIALNQKTMLQHNGLHVHVVHSGEKAVTYVADGNDADLILMDIDLGRGIDGTTAAQRILAIREVPIVFLTGHAEREMVERVRSITRYGYVLKNAGEFVLVEAIVMAFELFEAQQTIKRSENHLQSVLRSAPTGIGIVVDRVITEVNNRVCEMVGYPREELIGNSIRMLYQREEDFEAVGRDKYRQIREAGSGTVETTWMRKDGSTIEVELSSAAIDPADPHSEYTFTVLDITRRNENERSLTRALNEKSRLLTELNHRVKNNLHMVGSLISITQRQLNGTVDLTGLRTRVEAILTVHEKLSTTTEALEIDLQTYVPDLMDSVVEVAPVRPKIEIELPRIVLPAKSAVSVGLIINELITNAIKYSFPDTSAPFLTVSGEIDEARWRMRIGHNGKPMPSTIDLAKPATLGVGLELLLRLVEEMNGSITHWNDTDDNTMFEILIPRNEGTLRGS
jgi:PAS domain S-box-containing protein